MGLPEYKPEHWRFVIDSSKRRLKCVLLHNGNKFISVPISHAIKLKEKDQNTKFVLEKISYAIHQWSVYVDLKMMNFLLGQQGWYTKNIPVSYVHGIVAQKPNFGLDKSGL